MQRPKYREPDFSNLAAVLEKKAPSRPTLFEFFLNNRLYKKLVGDDFKPKGFHPAYETIVRGYDMAGYDYATILPMEFSFITRKQDAAGKTINLNNDDGITDRKSFDSFYWNDPYDCSIEEFLAIKDYLPAKMKIIPFGPGGVLENVVSIMGYQNLCMAIYDDEQLVYDIFEKVGSAFLKYYKRVSQFDFVGAVISNDDWGFNTQTMFSPTDMRRFVFPWHKQIVDIIHSYGKYAILHSCGNYTSIINDVIDDMKYDARHSYEDNIIPVEQAYEDLKGKIGVLGGIDVDFIVSKSCEDIYKRSRAMIERSSVSGGYALGTGNSVPEYVPDDNYFAMIKAALDI